jgi:hypothetical protein
MNPVSSTLHQPVTSVLNTLGDNRVQLSKSSFQNSLSTHSFPKENVRPPAMKLMLQVAMTIQSPNATTTTSTSFHPMYYFEAFTGQNGAWVYDCLFTEYRIVTLCEDSHQALMDEQEDENNAITEQHADSHTSSPSQPSDQ